MGNATVEAAIASNRWAMAGYIAIAVGMVAGVVMVQQITDRQESRNGTLDALES